MRDELVGKVQLGAGLALALLGWFIGWGLGNEIGREIGYEHLSGANRELIGSWIGCLIGWNMGLVLLQVLRLRKRFPWGTMCTGTILIMTILIAVLLKLC